MMKFLDWRTGNLSALIISAILGFGGLAYQNHLQEQARIERIAKYRAERDARNAEPIENWIEVKSIYVPDFAVGEDAKAMAVFDLVRKLPATYKWILSVRPVIENANFLCIASDERANHPGEESPATGISMTWLFRERSCPWYPGAFKMELTINLSAVGYENKIKSWESNIFNVLPPGAQQYLLPEQVQKLEEIQ